MATSIRSPISRALPMPMAAEMRRRGSSCLTMRATADRSDVCGRAERALQANTQLLNGKAVAYQKQSVSRGTWYCQQPLKRRWPGAGAVPVQTGHHDMGKRAGA